jgi:hypothetical protein
VTNAYIGRPPWTLARPGPPPQVRLPLWDELYLLAPDDSTGNPSAHPTSRSVGLAGAVLIDLLRTGRARLVDGRIRNEYLGLPGDSLAEAALAHLRRIGPLPPVRGWLRGFGGPDLYQRVQANLVSVGILRRHSRRFRSDRYQPVHTVWTVRARGHVRSVLYGYDQPDAQLAALCGLLDAVNIPDALSLSEPAGEIRQRLRAVASTHLPPVRHVSMTVGELIGDLATAAYG